MGWRDSLDRPSKQTIKETHYSGKKKREMSDETRLKISQKTKERWDEDPSFREKKEEVLRNNNNRKRKSQEQIFKGFKQTHGDRYDYSKVEYVNLTTKVIIICSEHGEFLQQLASHLNGSGCPECGRKKPGNGKNTTPTPTPKVIEQFREIHGDRYDYSKVEYVERSQKVIIICKDHGDFLQRRQDHKNGSGCPKCERNRKIETRTRELVEQFRAVHGDRYDYSKVEYVSKRKTPRVTVICPSHGEVQVGVMGHVRGSHCKKCAQRDRVGSKNKKLSNNL